jgi:hypothetical protein
MGYLYYKPLILAVTPDGTWSLDSRHLSDKSGCIYEIFLIMNFTSDFPDTSVTSLVCHEIIVLERRRIPSGLSDSLYYI